MTYVCPVCGYSRLEAPPADFTICPSCGTEFELDDEIRTHEQLRRAWLERGAPWFSEAVEEPAGWAQYRAQQLFAYEFDSVGDDHRDDVVTSVLGRQVETLGMPTDNSYALAA